MALPTPLSARGLGVFARVSRARGRASRAARVVARVVAPVSSSRGHRETSASSSASASTATAVASVATLASAATTLAIPDAANAAEVLPSIVASFNLATFTPQAFWLLMILAPESVVTRVVMGSWVPVLIATGIHVFVDGVGFTQPGALEEAAKFGAVFDPSIPPWSWADGSVTGPLVGFQSMLENPNFVTEEWAHVLAWDLFVGRWMWLDATARGVPLLGPSLLLTNFTGPPGLIQYFIVCVLSGKGLPPSDGGGGGGGAAAVASLPAQIPAADGEPDAGALISRLWRDDGGVGWNPEEIVAACADAVAWEDLSHSSDPIVGRAAVRKRLSARFAADAAAGASLVVERRALGSVSGGFTWHRSRRGDGDSGGRGLRGTTFVEVDDEGRIVYVREIAEPILKPGGATAELLKAVAKPPATPPGDLALARTPATASDLVAYLWLEVQGSKDFRREALRFFDEDVVYEDLNFALPFAGADAVGTFLEEFDIPGLTFVPDRISDGKDDCCFTWEVDLGVEGASRVKGISFYACDASRAAEEGGVRCVLYKSFSLIARFQHLIALPFN